MATCATAASTLFSLLLVLTFTCATVVRSKSVNRNTVLDDDDEMDASELIDSFLERAKQNTRHHRTHRLARRHRVQAYSPQLTSLDAHGREYVKCRKSMIEGGSVTRRCYRPPSDDMRVGCYAVWDMKTESLVQDCWVQQAISMNNCEQHKCVAGKSTFCCCYGNLCNSRYELQEEPSNSEENS